MAGSVRLIFPLFAGRWGGPELPLPTEDYRIVLASGVPVRCSAQFAGQVPQEGETVNHHYRLTRNSRGELVIGLAAPLAEDERSRVAQERLSRSYQQSSFAPTDTVLFQSYRGEFATDSQLALHAELRARRPDLELLWGVMDRSVAIPEGGRALLIESREWYIALGSSRYLCPNIEFERYFRKRPYQRYLQTFHGYPFKSMGISLWRVQGRPESVIDKECTRRSGAWDAIVVPESFCVDLYRQEYRFTGEALVTGYPRNDALVTADTASVRARVLAQLGIQPDQIVVLYAPTWRDTVATSAWTAKLFDGLDLQALAERLGDRFAVLVRGHNYNLREGFAPLTGKVWDVSDYPEINDLLLAADVAVLDYSSIRFDWLITGKPVVFFVPDLEDYLSSRKVLFDYHRRHRVRCWALPPRSLKHCLTWTPSSPSTLPPGNCSTRSSTGSTTGRRRNESLMRFSSSTAASRVVDVILDCLIVLLAFIGVVLALGGSAWAPLWVLLSVLGAAGQFVQTALERAEEWSPLGRSLVLRGTAAAATAVCLAAAVPSRSQALGAALGAAILVGSIAVEPIVARATRFKVPIATRLPNLPTRRPMRDLGSVAVAASAVGTTAGLLLAALGASSWWWTLISLLAVVPVAVLAVEGRGKVLLARRLRRLVPRAVAAYAPDFVVYASRPDDASYQVTMWLPYLQRAGIRLHHHCAQCGACRALAELTDVPVVEARGIADLDALVVPSLKAAFYVNASSGNGALVRFQHLTHIYLGHGDSDKPPSYNPTHAMYDQIFAAGPAATRQFAAHGVRIPAEKFASVGRPQVRTSSRARLPSRTLLSQRCCTRQPGAAMSRKRCCIPCR